MQKTTVNIQNNIKIQLAKKGMSVRDLERKSGLKYSVVQNILHGRSKNPAVTVLQKISKELGCSIQQLLEYPADELTDSNDLNLTSSESIWDSHLYLDSVMVVQKIIQKKENFPSKKQAMLCINEVYNYSLGISEKADPRFAEWVIDKFLYEKY